MSGLALTGGSLLSVFQGKRVYQPLWQIIYVYCPPGTNAATSSQILVSDGIDDYLCYTSFIFFVLQENI